MVILEIGLLVFVQMEKKKHSKHTQKHMFSYMGEREKERGKEKQRETDRTSSSTHTVQTLNSRWLIVLILKLNL